MESGFEGFGSTADDKRSWAEWIKDLIKNSEKRTKIIGLFMDTALFAFSIWAFRTQGRKLVASQYVSNA